MRSNLSRILVASTVLALTLVAVHSDSGPTTRKAADLGKDRALTCLSTDKPIYKSGEKVYVRGVMLSADGHKPLAGAGQAMVEIKGPKGDTVASGIAQRQDSVAAFAWEVPAEQPGGEYTLRMSFPWDGFAPAERKFDVRQYRAPRLKSQIVFVRDGYGPGDTAGANLHVERAEGGIPVGAKVTATALVDGQEAYRGESIVDAAGNCVVTFKLPEVMPRGEGTLAMAIEDGGVIETAAKTIPILLQTVDLKMYPEGGDLVAGLAGRVYVEAKTPAQKPADLAGSIVDSKGNEIVAFRTEHEGRGRFAFTPAKGEKYTLKITEPAGIKTTYPLPAAKDNGVVLTASADVVAKDSPIQLKLAATTPGAYKVTLARREAEVASAKVEIKDNTPADVTLAPPATADGVLIATAWDEKGNPLAERLIFRNPARQLNIKVLTEQSTYVPGEKVTLKVSAADDAGKPVAAVVGITITDDSVLEMIDKREQAPRLPVMVFLENDVRELADAHVYMDEQNAKAPLAVDLLLGTQGWRRFATIDMVKFLADNGDAGRRVLAQKLITDEDKAKLAALMPATDAMFAAGMPDGGAPRPRAMLRGAMRNGAVEKVARPEARPVEAMPAMPPVAVAPPPAEKEKQDLREMAPKDQQEAAQGKMEMGRRMRPQEQGNVGNAAIDLMMAEPIAVVREYAHVTRPGRIETDRIDFAETIYWNAGVKTDEKTGLGTFSFSLSDAVTTFRVFADGFDSAGAIGSATGAVQSIQPFYVEPKMPLELTSGDVVKLPLALVNGTGRDLPMVKITPTGPAGITFAAPPGGFTLKSRDRARTLLEMHVGDFIGAPMIAINTTAGPYADKVTRNMVVVPMGFPVEFAKGGMMEPNGTIGHDVVIPRDVVKGSLTAKVQVHPTPLGNLTAALERLIQEPSGCFEQTSSISYPLVMAQQYFLTHTGVEARVIDKAKTHLDSAYKKLAGFECKQKGYEWFGADPGHEALTAYGLMQFVDMTQVREVDQQMIQRTRKWLMDRRDGKGGFARKNQALDSFGNAPAETTNLYCTWALLESGEKAIDKEIESAKTVALASTDSYQIALGANIAALSGDMDTARKLMDKLAKVQNKDGGVDGGKTSITCSGGDALRIETTALTVLAWIREPQFIPQTEKAMSWLMESCKAGRFGSTQSTILALRAIINYDKSRARPKAEGTVTVLVDGKAIGEPVKFDPKSEGALPLPEIAELLTPGAHKVELKMDRGSAMPYSLAVNYFNALPDTSDKCQMKLEVAMRDAALNEGDITEARVTVTNTAKEVAQMPVAIIGIPGGLEVRHDQLKELVKSGKIDAYEVIGRQVVLYWRGMKAEARAELPISLIAAIPGAFTSPASRTYLYYTDEHKQWVPGTQVTIKEK